METTPEKINDYNSVKWYLAMHRPAITYKYEKLFCYWAYRCTDRQIELVMRTNVGGYDIIRRLKEQAYLKTRQSLQT